MNIFQAKQICKDIENLHKTKGIRRVYHRLPLYQYTKYSIDILNDTSKISASRSEKHLSADKYVPINLWTLITDTAGNYATIPLTFTVEITNKGLLPHAPAEKCEISGMAARIIYNKMKKEYKLAKKHQYER